MRQLFAAAIVTASIVLLTAESAEAARKRTGESARPISNVYTRIILGYRNQEQDVCILRNSTSRRVGVLVEVLPGDPLRRPGTVGPVYLDPIEEQIVFSWLPRERP